MIRVNENGQEFVVNNPAVRKYGTGFLEAVNAGTFELGALPGNIAAGMASPNYGASGGAGGGGGLDAASIDAIAKKINITMVNVPDERAAKRIDRRSQAAGDIVAIVKANKAEIFRQGV